MMRHVSPKVKVEMLADREFFVDQLKDFTKGTPALMLPRLKKPPASDVNGGSD